MIDAHCHLDRIEEPLIAATAGLRALVTVATDPERVAPALRMAEADGRIFVAAGIHPNEATLAQDASARDAIRDALAHDAVVAVGETGFDNHWRSETLAAQRIAFHHHADWAAGRSLPLVLHVRDAQGSEDASLAALAAIRDRPETTGVLHCCNGHERLLQVGLEHGWSVSFAGNVSYPSAKALRTAAAEVPAARLMVETDAPFLAPMPHRGKRNRPSYVREVARAVAQARGESEAQVEATTDANAIRFYRLPGFAP